MASRSPIEPESPLQSSSRRKFTSDEDDQLRSLVDTLGTKSWEEIARFMPDRTARQCRDRYKNYLLENLITEPWTPEEDEIVIRQFHVIGPKWVQIGKMLSGRSGNNVKNRWHKHLSRGGQPKHGAAVPSVVREERSPASSQPAVNPWDWWEADSAEPSHSIDRFSGNGFYFEDSLF
jgi:hypothetical protein